MATPRTYKVDTPLMKGEDIKNWQAEVKHEFKEIGIDCPIKVDGIYGVNSRSYTASLCHALGMLAEDVMKAGLTPALRTRIRNRDLTTAEKARMEDRVGYRRKLRNRWEEADETRVHRPVTKILADSWGYHPGVHDGIDVVCQPNAQLFAMVRAKVVDVRSGGWWGKAPSGDVSKGDGIVQLEVLDSVGPFKKGYHIGYGHCEHASVREGQIVDAGDKIAKAGLAVAWHIHLMYNTGNTDKGVGNVDPRGILDYAVKHG